MTVVAYQVETMLKLGRMHADGKMTSEDLHAQVALSNNLYKWATLTHNMSKEMGPKKGPAYLREMGLISNGSTIGLPGGYELETLKCQDQSDAFITRGVCLEYSSAAEHMGPCQGCQHYSTTRKLLIDNEA